MAAAEKVAHQIDALGGKVRNHRSVALRDSEAASVEA